MGVNFPGIGIFDVLWDSLQIIDEAYLAEAQKRETERWEALKSAKNVVQAVGPRGGFRYLSYEYVDRDGMLCHVSSGNRDEAKRLVEFFKQHRILVREEVIR